MRCTVVLEFDADDAAQPSRRIELMRFHRNMASPPPGDVGLTLEEGKTVLLAVQQEFVVEQIARFCEPRRACPHCQTRRRLHDGHCSEVKTIFGNVSYCCDRWKACPCGADGSRYVSPLKDYLPAASSAELRWLHAKLGAMLPYRQAHTVMQLLLPLARAPQPRDAAQPHSGDRHGRAGRRTAADGPPSARRAASRARH